MKIAFAFLLYIGVAFAASVKKQASETVQVDFVGSSGQIKLYYTDTKKPEYCKINWDKLEEVVVDGTGAVISTLPSVLGNSVPIDWDLTPVAPYQVLGRYTDAKAWFEVSAFLAPSDTSITVGTRTVSVPQNYLKFTVNISNWDWAGAGNDHRVRFGCNVVCHTDESGEAKEKETENEGTDSETEAGDAKPVGGLAEFTPDAFVTVDNVEIPFPAKGLYLAQLSQHKMAFRWVFPHFTNSLLYDPLLTLNPAFPWALVIGCSVGGVVLVCLGTWCICRYQRKKKAATMQLNVEVNV